MLLRSRFRLSLMLIGAAAAGAQAASSSRQNPPAVGVVSAAPAVPAAHPAVGLATGAETGTYYAFGRDIASVSQSMGQPVTLTTSSGSIENLRMMTEAGHPDNLGIVQSDVLGFLQRSQNENSRRVAAALRLVFPFYQEEVHVLARNDIKSMADLNGKRVVIGQPGSGNIITAINVLSLLGIAPSDRLQMPPPEGIVAVLSGKADAMIFVGGKPVPLFDHLGALQTADSGKNADLLKTVHFVPLTDARLMTDYTRAQITPQDYAFIKEPVPTVAVTAVLVAEDYSSGRDQATIDKCSELQAVGSAIRQNLDYLKRNGHPKWREVDPERQLAGWKRDMCSWRNADVAAIEGHPPQPGVNEGLQKDLLQVIRTGSPQPQDAAVADTSH